MILAFAHEARAGLYGVVRLAARDPKGLDLFNLTVAGFWRSFLAAAVALPVFAVERMAARVIVAELDPDRRLPSPLEDLTIYLAGWPLAAVALLGACVLLRKTDRFAVGVIALNWLTVLTQTAVCIAEVAAAVVPAAFTLIVISVLMAILVVEYRVLRIALALDIAPAIGVVAAVTLVDNLASAAALRVFV